MENCNPSLSKIRVLPGLIVLLLVLTSGCNKNRKDYKASGIFEGREVIVSAESSGKLLSLDVEEGMVLDAGSQVGLISCSQQELSVQQAQATLESIDAKKADAGPNIKVLEQQVVLNQNQIRILEDQLAALARDETRLQRLVEAEAAPVKQLDDIRTQKSVVEKQITVAKTQVEITRQQIEAARQNVAIQNRAILSEKSPLSARLDQLEDLEERCKITNPIRGTVLTQYAYAHETVNAGKALYKIADLDTLYLKTYITGTQLGEIRLGQDMTVMIDQGGETVLTYPGIVTWITDKAEFTPKSIMTVDERANLVYPIKIKVANDGRIKLGMFAEVNW